MSKTDLFLFIFWLVGITTSYAEPIRGNNVEPAGSNEYSFVVSIGIRDNQFDADLTHFCTGTLISRQHVLTSAHCFKGHLLGEIQVVLGSVDLKNGTKYDPSSWITFDQWAEEKKISKEFTSNDIAIIKLSEKVKKTVAKPVTLSCTNPSKLHNKTVTLAGWGFTNDASQPSQFLQITNVKLLANENCEGVMSVIANERIPVKKSYFCTRAVPFNLLDCGDSGGPVLSEKNELLGVNKGTCPKPNLPYSQKFIDDYRVNVHVGLHYYKFFVKDVIRNF